MEGAGGAHISPGCYHLDGGRLRWIEEQELPKAQLAGGLIAAGLGDAMVGRLWAPCRDADTLALTVAGAGLLVGSFD